MGSMVAVIGATGNVGREMLSVLHERGFPADEVVAIASRRSLGTDVSYGEGTLKVKALEHLRFRRHRHRADVGGRIGLQGDGRPRSPARAASSSITRRPGATTRTFR